ncbi:MAG: hypothetical protein VB137_04360 [Burkholderia sp.]
MKKFVLPSSRSSNRYNREWRLEKLGFNFPLEARQAALLALAA